MSLYIGMRADIEESGESGELSAGLSGTMARCARAALAGSQGPLSLLRHARWGQVGLETAAFLLADAGDKLALTVLPLFRVPLRVTQRPSRGPGPWFVSSRALWRP